MTDDLLAEQDQPQFAVGASWLTAFIDLAIGEHDRGTEFWLAVTGCELSESRGEHGEFATLVPPSGDDHLRLQRLGSHRSGVHPDLHIADLDAAAGHAQSVGATLVSRSDHAVLTSPGGYPFCLVQADAAEPAPPATWPDGHRSRADQLTIDIPAADYERECRFWSDLTGLGSLVSNVALEVPPPHDAGVNARACAASADW